MTTPNVTVVLCSYNRAHKIGRALDALAQQSMLPGLEIIVVDDGSTDGTRELVAARQGVRLISHEVNKGLAAARNTGLAAATTDWVAFTDDDCLPAPRWAEDLFALAGRHPEAMAVGGRVRAEPARGVVNLYLRARSPFAPLELTLLSHDGFVHRLREYLRRSATPETAHAERPVASLSGANMAVRRAVVDRLGGWDTRFVIGGEEEELFRRALAEGLELVYGPIPLVEHDFDNTLTDLVGRSHRYGRGNARMHAKHGGLPTLYPAPMLVAAGLALTPISRAALVAAVVVPQVLFSVWPREAVRQRVPAMLVFPYLQVLQEGASNAGWLQAWLVERGEFDEGAAVDGLGGES